MSDKVYKYKYEYSGTRILVGDKSKLPYVEYREKTTTRISDGVIFGEKIPEVLIFYPEKRYVAGAGEQVLTVSVRFPYDIYLELEDLIISDKN